MEVVITGWKEYVKGVIVYQKSNFFNCSFYQQFLLLRIVIVFFQRKSHSFEKPLPHDDLHGFIAHRRNVCR